MIADSSVLIILARAGRLDLLRAVFVRVTVPPQVAEESAQGDPPRPGAIELRKALDEGWLEMGKPRPAEVRRLARAYPNLGGGEAAAIALARERGEGLLIDDKAGRAAARLEGIEALGSLGVLGKAFHAGAFKSHAEAADVLRDLLRAGLWVGPDVIETFWARLGGRP